MSGADQRARVWLAAAACMVVAVWALHGFGWAALLASALLCLGGICMVIDEQRQLGKCKGGGEGAPPPE
jgi:hypothetical protein